jgi:hypothetical protein
MNFEKIAGYLGHFVLSSDGAIVSSGGDLGSPIFVTTIIARRLQTEVQNISWERFEIAYRYRVVKNTSTDTLT